MLETIFTMLDWEQGTGALLLLIAFTLFFEWISYKLWGSSHTTPSFPLAYAIVAGLMILSFWVGHYPSRNPGGMQLLWSEVCGSVQNFKGKAGGVSF